MRKPKKPSIKKRPVFSHTIEVVDDLMVVLDEDGNGYDCHVLRTRLAAERQLRSWQREYVFDMAEGLKTLAEYFSD